MNTGEKFRILNNGQYGANARLFCANHYERPRHKPIYVGASFMNNRIIAKSSRMYGKVIVGDETEWRLSYCVLPGISVC
jgi:hypothetical protein